MLRLKNVQAALRFAQVTCVISGCVHTCSSVQLVLIKKRKNYVAFCLIQSDLGGTHEVISTDWHTVTRWLDSFVASPVLRHQRYSHEEIKFWPWLNISFSFSVEVMKRSWRNNWQWALLIKTATSPSISIGTAKTDGVRHQNTRKENHQHANAHIILHNYINHLEGCNQFTISRWICCFLG